MAIFQGNRYSFRSAEHWRRGASDNFDISGAGLSPSRGLLFDPIPGTGDECAALPAFDPLGHLYWLRAGSGELVRRHDVGNEVVATLVTAKHAKALVIGFEVVWILAANGLHRYMSGATEYAGQADISSARTLLDIAGDGGEGVYVLALGEQSQGLLTHYDRFGCICGAEIGLGPMPHASALVATGCGELIILVAAGKDADEARPNQNWRLLVVTPSQSPVTHEFAMDRIGAAPRIAIDTCDRIHVTSTDPCDQIAGGGPGKRIDTYRVNVSLTKTNRTTREDEAKQTPECRATLECIARREVELPHDWRLQAIAAAQRLVFAGKSGLGWLSETGGGARGEMVSTFITRTLASPDGIGSRWNSADVDAVMSAGNALEIAVATSASPVEIAAIERFFDDDGLTQTQQFEAINARIPWDAARTSVFTGETNQPTAEKARILLDHLPQTHLWLRIRVYTDGATAPARIKALTVFYPERSYLEFLPAMYRENEASASQLRRFLAPVEALFDEIDDVIEELPRRADPSTAPSSLPGPRAEESAAPTWKAFLLRWLGFPAVESLGTAIVDALLRAAPNLLAGRGTQQTLQDVLDILTAHHARIQDKATLPGAWILMGSDARGRGARLGFETVVAGADPQVFQVGVGRANTSRLQDGCVDPVALLERSNGDITITLGLDLPERGQIEPLLPGFLDLFVPAQCSVRLIILPTAQWRSQIGLENGFVIAGDGDDPVSFATRLVDEPGGRLGSTTGLGRWQLPRPAFAAGLRTAILNKVHVH